MKKTKTYYFKQRAARILAYSLAASMSMSSVLPAMAASEAEVIEAEAQDEVYEEAYEAEGAEAAEELFGDGDNGPAVNNDEDGNEGKDGSGEGSGSEGGASGDVQTPETSAADPQFIAPDNTPAIKNGNITTYFLAQGEANELTLTLDKIGDYVITKGSGVNDISIGGTEGAAKTVTVKGVTTGETVINVYSSAGGSALLTAKVLVLAAELQDAGSTPLTEDQESILYNNGKDEEKAASFRAVLKGYTAELAEKVAVKPLYEETSTFDSANKAFPGHMTDEDAANDAFSLSESLSDGTWQGTASAKAGMGNQYTSLGVQFTVDVDGDNDFTLTTDKKVTLVNRAQLDEISLSDLDNGSDVYENDNRSENIKLSLTPADAYVPDAENKPQVNFSVIEENAGTVSPESGSLKAKLTPAADADKVNVKASVKVWDEAVQEESAETSTTETQAAGGIVERTEEITTEFSVVKRGIKLANSVDVAVAQTISLEPEITPETSNYTVEVSGATHCIVEKKSGENVIDITGTTAGNDKITITATDANGKEIGSAQLTVNVKDRVAVKSIELSENNLNLYANETKKLTAKTNPTNATNPEITWSVAEADKQYVTVDEDGTVHAIKATPETGVTVTATALNYEYENGRVTSKEVTATAKVIVLAEETINQIQVSEKAITLTAPLVNESGKELLKAGTAKVTYQTFPENATGTVSISNSDSSVVSYVENETGSLTITALKKGSTTLTISAGSGENAVKAEVTVTVEDSVADGDKAQAQEGFWMGALPNGGSYTYTGAAIKPEPNVYYDGTLLKAGTDYTISYKNNSAVAGTNSSKRPEIIVKGKGDYKNLSDTAYFTITKAALSDEAVRNGTFILTNLEAVQKKNGKPTILYKGKAIPAKEYEVTSTETKDTKGNVTYSVAINIYEDSKSFEGDYNYTWAEKDLLKASSVKIVVNGGKALSYTGDAQTPSFTVTANKAETEMNTTELAKNFTWTWTNNTKAGTAKLTLYAKNGGDYTGSKTQSFKIEKVDLKKMSEEAISETNTQKKLTVSFDAPTYSKSGAKPSPVVILKGATAAENKTLTEGVDYKVSYLYETVNKVAKAKVGVKITGIGGYKGTYQTPKAEYKAATKASLADAEVSIGEFYYTNKADAYKKVKIKVYDEEGKELKAVTDYTVDLQAQSSIPAAGSRVKVTITATENGMYSGTITRSFMVLAGKINGAKITMNEVELNSDGTITFTEASFKEAKLNGKDLTYGAEGDFGAASYTTTKDKKGNITGGKVILTGLNKYSGSKTVSFKVKKTESTSDSTGTNTTGSSDTTGSSTGN